MMDRIEASSKGDQQALSGIEKQALERNAKYKNWICDEEKMARTKSGDALYMHCLPADIGAEVTPGVMKKHQFNVSREAQFKVYVIMAMLASAKVPDLAERLQS